MRKYEVSSDTTTGHGRQLLALLGPTYFLCLTGYWLQHFRQPVSRYYDQIDIVGLYLVADKIVKKPAKT